MTKLEELLKDWRNIEPDQITMGRIKRDEVFQPRNLRLVPYRDRGRLESESDSHIAYLASKLEDGRDLEPVLVARVEGKLMLVDGHHRFMAYRRQSRSSIPSRVKEATLEEALTASKAVNCDGVKLPMHDEQKREAAWQYMAIATHQGRHELPPCESLRGIGRTFGVSKDTVTRMRQAMLKVDPSEFAPIACDSGTNWPMWKYVKGNATRDRFADLPEEAKDEQLASKLGAIIESNGVEAVVRAIRLLENEAVTAAVERLAEAVDEASSDY